jgi:YHS domain-containing protein
MLSSIQMGYKLVLNVLGLAIFGILFWLTARRGATDPVCGMKVDRDKTIRPELAGQTQYSCPEHCLDALQNRTEHEHTTAHNSHAADVRSAR